MELRATPTLTYESGHRNININPITHNQDTPKARNYLFPERQINLINFLLPQITITTTMASYVITGASRGIGVSRQCPSFILILN
jgi:hypothetical protein